MSSSKRPRSGNSLIRRLNFNRVGTAFAAVALVAVMVGLLISHSAQQSASPGSAPGKPKGTQMGPVSSSEQWNVAQGLPKQTLSLTFSTSSAGTGFAAAFVNKGTQAIYATTDTGTSWQQIGSVQAPVADALVADPSDGRDLAMLSFNSPAPGTYTIQRSGDGGRTWQAQATTLPSNATVTQLGWDDSTLLVAFQLDRQPSGDSALIAFPSAGASYHLDVDGKINGISIPFIQLITSLHHRVQVWGTDDAQSPHIIGLATANQGKTWQTLSETAGGKAIKPIATTADGKALVAITADHTQVALSRDGGLSWQLQKGLSNGTFHEGRDAYVTGAGTMLLHVADGTNPGAYSLRNGDWAKVTGRDVIAVSSDVNGNLTRLWSYDANGNVNWMSF